MSALRDALNSSIDICRNMDLLEKAKKILVAKAIPLALAISFVAVASIGNAHAAEQVAAPATPDFSASIAQVGSGLEGMFKSIGSGLGDAFSAMGGEAEKVVAKVSSALDIEDQAAYSNYLKTTKIRPGAVLEGDNLIPTLTAMGIVDKSNPETSNIKALLMVEDPVAAQKLGLQQIDIPGYTGKDSKTALLVYGDVNNPTFKDAGRAQAATKAMQEMNAPVAEVSTQAHTLFGKNAGEKFITVPDEHFKYALDDVNLPAGKSMSDVTSVVSSTDGFDVAVSFSGGSLQAVKKDGQNLYSPQPKQAQTQSNAPSMS
jgi:hypothetical protein